VTPRTPPESATELELHKLQLELHISGAPGFCNGGSEVWVYRGSRVRSPLEADTFTAVHREFVGFGTV